MGQSLPLTGLSPAEARLLELQHRIDEGHRRVTEQQQRLERARMAGRITRESKLLLRLLGETLVQLEMTRDRAVRELAAAPSRPQRPVELFGPR
jgi:hypothetical protein